MLEKGYNLKQCPIETFNQWYADALKVEQNAGAFTLSTVGLNGAPNSRQLLLKGCDDRGFLFFTNYESVKAKEMEANNYVGLNFYWHTSEVQVRVRATVEKCDEAISKEYFFSRGFDSKIASTISKQSRPVKDRQTLEQEYLEYKESLESDVVPYPKSWGGYMATPYEMTFFIYGEHRLNDRFNYTKEGSLWKVQRLYP